MNGRKILKISKEDRMEKELEELVLGNCRHTLFEKTAIAKTFTLNIGEFNHEGSELDTILDRLSNATINDYLIVNISSPGGYVYELDKLTNIMESCFYGRITTRILSHAYSCGALIFLKGDERIVHENSRIMFHEVSKGYWGKQSDIINQHKFDTRYYKQFLTNELSPFFTRNEIKSILSGKEYWIDPYTMCEREICTDVFIFGELMKAKEYAKHFKNNKSKLKYYKDIINDETLSARDKFRIEKFINGYHKGK